MACSSRGSAQGKPAACLRRPGTQTSEARDRGPLAVDARDEALDVVAHRLEKSGRPQAAEQFRRAALNSSEDSGADVGAALARSRLGINLLLQQRFAEAAHCLEQAHAGLLAAAPQRPSAWAMHLMALGLIALDRDELEVAAARLSEALAAFRLALHEVDPEDPLLAADLLLTVRERWTADDVHSVGDVVLSVLEAADSHDLSLGLECLQRLALANDSLSRPDALLRSELMRAAATCLARAGVEAELGPAHAAAIACIMRDCTSVQAFQRLASALAALASRLAPGSEDRTRALALRVHASVGAGRLEQGRRIAAAALRAPLTDAGDLPERWLESAKRLLVALREAGRLHTALQLKQQFEDWLLDAAVASHGVV